MKDMRHEVRGGAGSFTCGIEIFGNLLGNIVSQTCHVLATP